MKSTLEKLYRILLIPILLSAIAIVGFIGYRFYRENQKVIVPDFSKMTSEEIYSWCGSLNTAYSCEIKSEKSKTVKENGLISQEPSAGGILTDKAVIIFSSGLIYEVQLPDLSGNVTLTDIKAWAADNGIQDLTVVEEETNAKQNGCVIRIEPVSGIYPDTAVTVYVAKAQGIQPNENGEIEIKAGEYAGMSVSSFETLMRTSGLKPNHNTSRDMYSDAVNKGDVVWHGSGIYEKDETINYGLSLGKNGSGDQDIEISFGDYISMDETEVVKKIKELGLVPNHNRDRDAYSDTMAKGKVVWHGSGTYEKNETFNYGLSLGKNDGSSSDEIVIKEGAYIGLSESDFIAKAKELGLAPMHKSDRDDYSDTVEKGKILTHGYGTYEKGEAFNYGLSLGKKDGSSSDQIVVAQGAYIGLTESQFIAKAKELGLTPTHKSDRDAYSDTVEKGKVITHGYGTYEKGEAFNYGLSLGKQSDSSSSQNIVINANQYVNLTASDFETRMRALKLDPYHDSSKDAYSDTVEKGKVIWHGSGTYVENERIRYGLSLGKNESPTINVPSYAGQAESALTAFLSQNGLVGRKTEQYSDTIASGYIISNDTGNKKAGDTVNYVVSKGAEPVQNITLASFADIRSLYTVAGDANSAGEKVKAYLSNAGFTNYAVTFASSRDDGIGVIMSITVDGVNHVSAKTYHANARIVVTICNANDNG